MFSSTTWQLTCLKNRSLYQLQVQFVCRSGGTCFLTVTFVAALEKLDFCINDLPFYSQNF